MFAYKPMLTIIHISAAIYNLFFVYTPLHNWSYGFMVVQYISIPLLVITGALLVREKKKNARYYDHTL